LIELIIAVLSMLAHGPFAPSLAPTNRSAQGSDGAASAQFASNTIENTVLAPSSDDATSLSASSTPNADIAPATKKIDLPVYTRVGPETKLDRYMNLASKRLDPRMQGALSHIPDDGRRLLALKYYTRRPGNLDQRWAMTAGQIAKHVGSKQHQRAVATVEAIKLRFAEQNPGYRLAVNTDVRSLEKQIEIWNTFASTEQAGNSILTKTERALANDKAWPAEPTPQDVARFAKMIASTATSRTPTAAAPGFSLHGTGRAFDFIIWKGDEIVAGAVAETVGTVWDKAGWTKKLKEAITAVSPNFIGPLRGPYEPWHYDYRPS
jgi:hypothetical protein